MLNHLDSARLNNAVNNVKNLDDLYEVTEKTVESVKSTYPQILCKSGCNACCKTYGSPLTTKLEWEKIKNFLDNADQQFKDNVKESLTEVKENLKRSVLENREPAPEKIINNIKCPFLQEEKCSIYAVRPLICRMFGNFVAKSETSGLKENVIFTCEMEQDRWNMDIQENKIKSLVLPSRDYFYDKLEELNNREQAVFLINRIDNYFMQKNIS